MLAYYGPWVQRGRPPSECFHVLPLIFLGPLRGLVDSGHTSVWRKPPHSGQIPYDYTVEMRNRFKGLDLMDRVPDELWTEVRDFVQETGIKTIPMEKKSKKQNCCLRRPYKYQGGTGDFP